MMHTYAATQKSSQQGSSASSETTGRGFFARNHRSSAILFLQRALGNQAVQRLQQTSPDSLQVEADTITTARLGHDFSRISIPPPAAGAIQTKLAINTPGDECEQEADRVAEQVMRMPEPEVQRQENEADSLPVVRSMVLRAPPTFRQDALTCWAAAIASWLLVKGIVKQGFSDQFLIDYYEGTSCVDSSGALVGEDAIEGVFAEWRLAIDMGTEIQQDGFDAATAELMLRQHGHFILGTGSGMLHAIVVYGIEVHSADDPLQYSLLVMDPILGVTEKKHHMFLDYPVRVAVGLPKSGGPAPCRSEP